MVNVGPLAAEIVSLVWGTPANFNGFHVLAALLHGVTGQLAVSQMPPKERKLECGQTPNVMAALPNIGGGLCSTPQSLADAHY